MNGGHWQGVKLAEQAQRDIQWFRNETPHQAAVRLGELLEDCMGAEAFARWFDEAVPVALPFVDLCRVYRDKLGELLSNNESLKQVYERGVLR